MPRVNRHVNWTHDKWPEPFRTAWRAAIKPGDAYTLGGPASRLSPRTVWNNERAFGRYQEFLDGAGLRDATDLPDLDNLRAYGKHLAATIAPYSVIANITQMTGALRAMFPKADLQYLAAIANRLKVDVQTVRPIEQRLIDPRSLIKIGNKIMQRAEHSEPRNGFAPQQFRDGALVVASAYLPLRMNNWRIMIIGEHIDLATGKVKFAAHEMKRRKPFEAALPNDALVGLRRYVEVYRSKLMKPGAVDEGYLFPSADGGILHRNSIGRGVKDSIARVSRRVFNIHLFRHSAATFISEHAPATSRSIAGVLHHGCLKTADKHYIRGNKLRAFKHFQGAVKEVVVRGRRRKANPKRPVAKRRNGLT